MLPLINTVVAVLRDSNPVIVAISLVTCWLTLAYLRKKKSKLPPGPTGLPLLGVALSVGKRPEETFRVRMYFSIV